MYNICRETMSDGITSKHQANTNSTKTHHRVVVFSCFFRRRLCPHVGLSSIWPFPSSFCCPSDGHVIGLTYHQQTATLSPKDSAWSMSMYVCFCFIFHVLLFSFFPCHFSFLIPGTWYSRCGVVARYLIHQCC